MATVTGFTSDRMRIIENTTVVDGEVRTDNLILVTREGTEIDAGSVRGPQGVKGDTGEVSQAELDAAMATVLAAMFKPGMLMMYAGGVLPTDWLKCDGTAIDRVTYAPLFAAIGTAYGVGNGTTTFNVPNFKLKFPVGLDTVTPNNVLGYFAGTATQTLSTANLPSHQHSINHNHTATSGGASARHTHSLQIFGFGGAATHNITSSGPYGWNSTIISGDTPDHSHTINVATVSANSGPVGTGSAHNNMPPYVVVNYMIHT